MKIVEIVDGIIEVFTTAQMQFLIKNAAQMKPKEMPVDDFMENIKESFGALQERQLFLREKLDDLPDYTDLQENLEYAYYFKKVADKPCVAICGGFSSGKSRFLNNLFEDDKLLLNVDSAPATAVASYIVNGKKRSVIGYTANKVLLSIANRIYKNFSHEYLKQFDINLNQIIPKIIITAPLKKYQHLCFMDTPGFNAAQTGNTAEDFTIANNNLHYANAILFLISAKRGTIESSDIGFLENVNLENKKLYFILSKADEKPESDLRDIMEVIKEELENYNIAYEGISVYSGNKDREYFYEKQSLDDFLNSLSLECDRESLAVNTIKRIASTFKENLDTHKIADMVAQEYKGLRIELGKMGVDIISSQEFISKEKSESIERMIKATEKMWDLAVSLLEKAFIVKMQGIFFDKEIPKDFEVWFNEKSRWIEEYEQEVSLAIPNALELREKMEKWEQEKKEKEQKKKRNKNEEDEPDEEIKELSSVLGNIWRLLE